MILRNPTDSTVSIQVDGVTYSVEPMGVTQNLSAGVADAWLKTHGFLSVESYDPEPEMAPEVTDTDDATTPEVVEIATVVEPEEEVAPEVTEEVVEAPKKGILAALLKK